MSNATLADLGVITDEFKQSTIEMFENNIEDLATEEGFQSLIQFAASIIGTRVITDEFGLNTGAVNRWISGKSSPVQPARQKIAEDIPKLIRDYA